MKTKEEIQKELIAKHIEGWRQPMLSSIEHFAKTGKASGGFYLALRNMMDEYASQFQQELPKAKDIVKKFIDSDEPDTFIRNEHGVLMYYSHDKQSGINLESYFEDLVQYVYDEISAKSPQPYNPKQP